MISEEINYNNMFVKFCYCQYSHHIRYLILCKLLTAIRCETRDYLRNIATDHSKVGYILSSSQSNLLTACVPEAQQLCSKSKNSGGDNYYQRR